MEVNSQKVLSQEAPEFSIQYSYSCLPRNKQQEFRMKIQKLIGAKTNKSVCDRINGTIEPKYSEAMAIMQIFKSYGIKVEWGRSN